MTLKKSVVSFLLLLSISANPLYGRGQEEAPWTFWYWMYGAVSGQVSRPICRR
jgi:hypothetical protein